MHPTILAQRRRAAQKAITASADALAARLGVQGELAAIRARFIRTTQPQVQELFDLEAAAAALGLLAERVTAPSPTVNRFKQPRRTVAS